MNLNIEGLSAKSLPDLVTLVLKLWSDCDYQEEFDYYQEFREIGNKIIGHPE